MMRRAPRSSRGINRRAFLRGAAGVSLALPFLESLPERSAWAAGDDPIFSLFICTACGVVPRAVLSGLDRASDAAGVGGSR